ncbi:TPA: ATP-binding protein, partial [Enterococcus faecium]|nr:ATP-binding protein [Enterococcus faecium]HAQ3838424.1 ATP-binding protein [Enterococcus faecium]HBE7106099.1 ATP-binding protein [Enterococcus faecium]HCC1615885.1 ATP-binding protein [Enterococcus faecium]
MIIKNLGNVKSIDIHVKDLLIFTGKNNTGKTYTSYILYGILSELFGAR